MGLDIDYADGQTPLADIVIEKIFKLQPYTWGSLNFAKQSDQRNAYLNAIKTADHGDIFSLIKFARS